MERDASPASSRTTIKRYPERARYDRTTVEAILDEGLICHLGFAADGQAFVIPTTYARDGRRMLIHGSPAARWLRAAAGGTPICATVTIVDGLVLARSSFHHSMNYRSVVVLGNAAPIEEPAEKLRAMEILVEHIVPGRCRDARGPSAEELRRTLILSVALDEASAKVRGGPPIDDAADMGLEVWAGELPLALATGAPIADPNLRGGIEVPDYVRDYRRGGRAR